MNEELLFKVGILALSMQLLGCTRSEVSFSSDVQPIHRLVPRITAIALDTAAPFHECEGPVTSSMTTGRNLDRGEVVRQKIRAAVVSPSPWLGMGDRRG